MDWERERVPTRADLGTGVVLAGIPCLLTLVAGLQFVQESINGDGTKKWSLLTGKR